jgi:hypothetical protein
MVLMETSGTNGNSGGYPYHSLDLMLSGHESWTTRERILIVSLRETQLSIQEAMILFCNG